MPKVADRLIEGLLEAGVQRLFGLRDGGAVAELLQAARAHELPFVAAHSGFAACVMAAVSGELTGAPGAAALGAEATDAVQGVGHAWRDRAPMILITAREASTPAPRQPLDRAALYAVVTKESRCVSADLTAHSIAHAAETAMTEPRGPVHLDLDSDVATQMAPLVAARRRPAEPAAPDGAALDAAAALIEAANRPLVIAGLGCRREDAAWVRAFAETLPAPVLATLKAKGTMPEPHPLCLGVFTGREAETPIMSRADAIITVGLDPTEPAPPPRPHAARVLHVARAPHTGEGYQPAVEVVGEPGLVLEELAPRLRGKARADWDVAEVDRIKREQARRLAAGADGLSPGGLARIARELTAAGTIAAIDGDSRLLSAALGWQAVAPGECLVPNGLATTGFALPAALAAQLVHPDRRVLCFTGVRGLWRVIAELETAARLKAPVVVIVLDDDGSSGAELTAVARGFGLLAFGAASGEAARRAISAALGADRAALVDARPAA